MEAGAGSGAVIVVILPDGGRNYLSKLYNDEWMRKSGLLATTGAVVRVADLLADRRRDGALPDLVLTRTTQRVGEAIGLFEQYGISQMPVSQLPEGDAVAGIIGSVTEKGLLDRAYRDPSVVERTVGEVMDRALPTVDVTASLDVAFGLLSEGGAPALVAVRGDRPAGVVTRLDLLEYLARHGPHAG
jgi:cystathionine beta-synthase